jgi:hypothetical protein
MAPPAPSGQVMSIELVRLTDPGRRVGVTANGRAGGGGRESAATGAAPERPETLEPSVVDRGTRSTPNLALRYVVLLGKD